MKKVTPTSKKRTSLSGEAGSTCSQEAFLANRSAAPENGGELPTTATCGPKCLEQFGKYVPAGSWGRTFSELLIGMAGWFSNRCVLIWKLKATPYNRTYFQLQVSAPRIGDTELGSSPTSRHNGTKDSSPASQVLPGDRSIFMLGTPTAIAKTRSAAWQKGRIPNLAGYSAMMASVVLPTPTSTDHKRAGMSRQARENYIAKGHQRDINMAVFQATGEASRLNPHFVEEMMGFPFGWTAYPFQDGIKKV